MITVATLAVPMRSVASGLGCNHCEVGRPIERIKSRAGLIKLCLECVLLWFPGRAAGWWEERHAPYSDHLGDSLDAAAEKECREAVKAEF